MRITGIFGVIRNRFLDAMERLKELTKVHGLRIGLWRFACEFCMQIWAFLSLHAFIAWQYVHIGAFQLGDYASLQGAAVNFSHFVSQISEEFIAIAQIGQTASFLRDFCAIPLVEDKGTRTAEFHENLTLQDVSFRYVGAPKDALHGVSLCVQTGEKIALVGLNGAGKTTLIKLMLRLYEPISGTIRMDGTPATEYTRASWQTQCAQAYQDFQIYAASIAENVLMRACLTEQDERLVWRALDDCGLKEKVHALPLGIRTTLTREFDPKGIELSGGEAQRIAVARVFASDAPICVLDEPSAALDPLGEYQFFSSLIKRCGGKTIVFVSHRLSSVTMADRILFLQDGAIAEQGSHAELMKKNGQYARMFLAQASNYQEVAEG